MELVMEQLIETEQRLTLSEEALVKEQATKMKTISMTKNSARSTNKHCPKWNKTRLQRPWNPSVSRRSLSLFRKSLPSPRRSSRLPRKNTKTFEGKLDKQRIDQHEEPTKFRKELESAQAELGAKLSNLGCQL